MLFAKTWVCVGLTLSFLTPNRSFGAQETSLRSDIQFARSRVYPALVNISVVTRFYADGRAQRNPAGGSGVIVSRQGYVLTNFHVADSATHITCTLITGESIDADVVNNDPLSDISVLKLRLGTRPNGSPPLKYAVLGNSDTLHVGDFVLAMGNPLMLSSSMTLGIASNTKRVFTDFTGTQIDDMQLDNGDKTGIFTRWIQHDALILPGNSGGPLVNMKGEVIGINELGGEGQGFAIPSNIAKYVLHEVLLHHKVTRGYVGLDAMPVAKLGRTTGTLVSSVTPNSPASRAGILPGDIILNVNGHPTDTRFFEQVPLFNEKIADISPGQKVAFSVLRSGKQLRIVTHTVPLQKFLGDEQEFRRLGISCRELTPEVALARHMTDLNGLIITGVRPGYPFEAAQPAIQQDDLIRTVNGRLITNLATFRKAVDAIKSDAFTVEFWRGDEHLLSTVKQHIDKPAADDGGELPQAWVGIETQVLTSDLATSLHETGTTGFRVSEVLPWTQASRSGLRVGDLITSLNGTPLQSSQLQDADDLKHSIESLSVGDKATFRIIRGSKVMTLPVILEQNPASAADAKSAKQSDLEFAVREITLADKAKYHWPEDEQGLLVTDATTGGLANIAGLHIDDLITSINDVKVPDVRTFDLLMRKILKSKPNTVKLFLKRDIKTRFVFIEPNWSKLAATQ